MATKAHSNHEGLTPKQKRFADEYLIDLNATAAYKRAGYKGMGNVAEAGASEILRNPKVSAYVKKRSAEIAEKAGLTAELVRRQWLAILTTDTNEVVQYRRTCCRFCYGKDFEYQRTADEMMRDRQHYDIEVAKAKAVDPKAEFAPFDEKGGVGYYHSKDPHPDCPECCGEGIGNVFFMDTRNLSPGARELYAGAKVSKDGVEVKMHSKDHIRELVAKHLNMFETTLEVNHTVTATKEALDAIYQLGIENAERQRQTMLERRKRRDA